MKKLIKTLCLSLATITAMTLAACGKGPNNDSNNGGNIGNESSDSPRITIAASADPIEQEIAKTFVKAYLAQPGNENKRFSVQQIGDPYDSWMQRQMYAKKLPDIVQVYDYKAEYWTGENLLVPVSDYMKRDGISEDNYFSAVIEMAKSKAGDDNMYWVPRDYNKVVCVYNTKMFELAGVAEPTDGWTFEDFKNICKALKEKEAVLKEYAGGKTVWAANINVDWAAVYYPIMKSFGGELIDTENGTAFKNEEAVKKTIDFLCDYVDKGYAVSTIDTMDTGSVFGNKQCAMWFTVRPNVPDVYDNVDGNINFVSFPKLTGVETSYIGMGCSGYGITTSCSQEKRELAWDFLKFVMSEEGQEAFCAAGGGIPMIKSLAEKSDAAFRTVYPNLNNNVFVENADRDLPMTYMKGFLPEKQLGIYNTILNNMMSSFYKVKPEERADRLAIVKGYIEKTFK